MRLIRGDLRFKQTGCSGSDAGVGARFTQLIERAIHGGAGQNRARSLASRRPIAQSSGNPMRRSRSWKRGSERRAPEEQRARSALD